MKNANNQSALIAVSGGLDSISLLFALAKNLQSIEDQNPSASPRRPHESGDPLKKETQQTPSQNIDILAQNFIQTTKLNQLEAIYLDHSQRPDTNLDLIPIQKICQQFNIKLHRLKLNLPPNCSEEQARKARYQALSLIQKKRKLNHLITAHHADDVLETALINLQRGSGPKGLSSLAHHPKGIWRPFLFQFQKGVFITKQDLQNYAKLNYLAWHEDSTNQDSKYLRNRLRAKLKSSKKEQKLELLNLIAHSAKLNSNLKNELAKLKLALQVDNQADNQADNSSPHLYSKSTFLELEPKLQQQFIHLKLTELGYDVNQKSVQRAVKFIKEASTKKTLQLKGCHIHIPQKSTFLFQPIPKK